jgi:hypothetical protein
MLNTSVCMIQHTFTLGVVLGITDADRAVVFLGVLVLSAAWGLSPWNSAVWFRLDSAWTCPPWQLWSLGFPVDPYLVLEMSRGLPGVPLLVFPLERNGAGCWFQRFLRGWMRLTNLYLLEMAQRKRVTKPCSLGDQTIWGAFKTGCRLLLSFNGKARIKQVC